ncbi:glycoside hydrolase family 3 N-terminal domain-containing protein [Galbibacter pacificus]|uniref:beta-glucosidase n=1 Tax=Galbibacter pacificus TaxID=2996052 RepID=A0ABT6FMV1_9FLAO|nr:glycoside hydrolase family 3 N-terminal domain-containing protein [Galbibacter pacificus]MDG3581067.1 glycoside hydrolase family 3 N-terminal domain-containing protein [Galbibacter pacificus]MDG3584545.1 glycoside hydrolase family 3 C-terminal domain-containing protein [Galbibacter pacificus]
MIKSKKAIFIGLLLMLYGCTYNTLNPIYKDASQSVDSRVADLISKMTLQEKIKQMDMYWGKEVAIMKGHDAIKFSEEKISQMMDSSGMGSIHDFYPLDPNIGNQIQKYALEKTRLGIPVMFIEEGLHGYSGKNSTTFPVPLQLASAWDSTLVKKIGRVIASESRMHGIHMILGPVLGLARDPRWGRVEETFGEDPYLTALNGTAMVMGLQGDTLSNDNAVIAEPKHFAIHSIPEAGSNIAPAYIGEREARSSFLVPFEMAVRKGKAKGIMAAYHELDGVPCVFNKWLLKSVLRDEWGFKGFVLSDLGAIRMTIENHKVVKDTVEALANTLNAGLNMQFYDFKHESFMDAIVQAVDQGLLDMETIDDAVGDILRLKFELGLFDNPYVKVNNNSDFHNKKHQYLALEAAQKSIVLLKNEKGILPISGKYENIAIIGDLATSTYPGGYSNPDKKTISILEGLKQRLATSKSIQYEKGYSLKDTLDSEKLKTSAVKVSQASDLAIVVIGENIEKVGEGKDRSDLELDSNQLELLKAVYGTGTPVVAILFNGRPLGLNWVDEHIPSIVESWFSGEKNGLAVADVLSGTVNPSGKLPISFPRSVGQLPFYYNHKPSSKHNYVDIDNTPLYSFGHGLSYTTYAYSNLRLSSSEIGIEDSLTVKMTITNTGSRSGEEVVQVYLNDMISSVTTPVKSLCGFKKVFLEPKESKSISFQLHNEAFRLWNQEMKHLVEPGTFQIMIGSSAGDIRLIKNIEIKK